MQNYFAVRRGEIKERIDPKFIAYGGHQVIQGKNNKSPLGELVLQEPDYGAAERAVPMLSPNDTKYIRITDYGEDGIEPNHEFVTAEFVDEKYLIEDEDILFARSGATAGKTFIYSKDLGKAIFAGYCIRFRFDKEKILPKYAYFYTKTNRYAAWVNSMQRAAGQPNINKEEYKSFVIPLPSLDIQLSLVTDMEAARLARKEKLSQADELIKEIDTFVLEQLGINLPEEEKRSTFAVRLDAVKQGRQDALYYAPYYEKLVSALQACEYPKDIIGNISPQLVGGATPSKGDADLYAEDGVKFLRILNIAPNEIILDNVNYIQENVHNGELKRSRLSTNDVLMTITGRVGTSAVVTDEILPANINQHIVKMQIQHKNCLPEYLAIYLNSSIGTALSNRGVTGGTRIALDYDVIRKIQIPLPPLETQKEIISELQHRRTQANALREEAEHGWYSAKEKFEQTLLG